MRIFPVFGLALRALSIKHVFSARSPYFFDRRTERAFCFGNGRRSHPSDPHEQNGGVERAGLPRRVSLVFRVAFFCKPAFLDVPDATPERFLPWLASSSPKMGVKFEKKFLPITAGTEISLFPSGVIERSFPNPTVPRASRCHPPLPRYGGRSVGGCFSGRPESPFSHYIVL